MLRLLPSLLALLFLAGCGGDAPSPDASDSHDAEAHARGEHDDGAAVWTCPMHPQVQQDEPGACPVCGMDLVRAATASPDDPSVVVVSDRTQQTMGVRTTRAAVERLERLVRTTGRFEAPEDARVAVAPKVGGWVERLYAGYEGARVRRGAPLAEIYSPDFVATQEEYLLALRHAERQAGGDAAEDADRLLRAAERRLAYWDVPAAQVERLRQTGTPSRTLTVYAPRGGVVTAKHVDEGQEIRAGQTVLAISDLSALWLMADVYEQDLAWVRPGAEATLTLPHQPGRIIQAEIDHLYDTLDPASRTVRARLVVPNPDGALRPGMFATAVVRGAPTAPSPVVPVDAVIRSGERDVVIEALGEGRFRPAEVTLGLEADGRVQILRGLGGGEVVVTRAQFLIDSEARLNTALDAFRGHQHDGSHAAPPSEEGAPTEDRAGEDRAGHDDAAMPQVAPGAAADSIRTVRIDVTTTFEPGRIELVAGEPTRLVFTRHTAKTCATEISSPALGIEETPLPLHEPTAIVVTPEEAGTFTFACAMDMIEGALVVKTSG